MHAFLRNLRHRTLGLVFCLILGSCEQAQQRDFSLCLPLIRNVVEQKGAESAVDKLRSKLNAMTSEHVVQEIARRWEGELIAVLRAKGYSVTTKNTDKWDALEVVSHSDPGNPCILIVFRFKDGRLLYVEVEYEDRTSDKRRGGS